MTVGIPQPEKVRRVFNQDAVDLQFAFEDRVWDGRYHMRGALCWPILIPVEGGEAVEGFILMAGYRIRTQEVVVFRETAFRAIDPVLDGSQRVLDDGIAGWLNAAWGDFLADTYFEAGPMDREENPYALDVYRSSMIQPKPIVVHLEGVKEEVGVSAATSLVARGKLCVASGGPLWQDGNDLRAASGKPSIRALMALAVGLQRQPWREVL